MSANKLKLSRAFRDTAINNLNRLHDLSLIAEHTEADKSRFRFAYEDFSSIKEKFEKHHVDTISQLAVNDGDLAPEEEIYAAFAEKALNVRIKYDSLFAISSPPPSDANSVSSVNNKPNVKLPKIDLPRFGGYFKDWPAFIDLYNSLIHSNSSLSEIEKFQYLQTSLTKEPLELIRGFSLSADNYILAYSALIKQYENKRKLVSSYWEEILHATTKISLRHLVNTYTENLAMLNKLGYKVEGFADFIITHSLINKLDISVRERYEREHNSNDLPTYKDLVAFLEIECRAQDAITHKNKAPYDTRKVKSALISTTGGKENNHTAISACPMCRQNHHLYTCRKFQNKTPRERYNFIKDNNRCINCLSLHRSNSCSSKNTCKQCRKPHHTLLHFDNQYVSQTANPHSNQDVTTPPSSQNNHFDQPSTGDDVSASTNLMVTHTNNSNSDSDAVVVMANSSSNATVLLATIMVEIADAGGKYHHVRAVLDSASQINFISEKCARMLQLPRNKLSVPLQGVGQMTSISNRGSTRCHIRSRLNASSVFNFEAVVMPHICGNLPSFRLHSHKWNHIDHLTLADPNFMHPQPIDLLIGAELFPFILLPGKQIGKSGEPSALNTVFGWVLMGKINCPINNQYSSMTSLCTTVESSIDHSIKRFWELEELPRSPVMSPEDKICESVFANAYTRELSGRFSVSLPFVHSQPVFKGTYDIARRRLLLLEKRLSRDSELRNAYIAFMQDYLDSGHMELAPSPVNPAQSYYIPHHGVWKPASKSIRVVFDASSKDVDGNSLNSTLFIGPKLQKDISRLLLSFRSHEIVFTADIRQMYRQILICPEHRDYQRILWRFPHETEPQEYRLNTVTYGVSSSPYLALRTLVQLAQDEHHTYPLAADILKNDIYVDDIITGCDSIEKALVCQKQLIGILASAGMELRKWASNNSELLSAVPPDHCQMPLTLDQEAPDFVKILGLQWNPGSDSFSFLVSNTNTICTKRGILSDIARMFDPLGFLTPITLLAKYFMQLLWSAGLQWDDPIPPDIQARWHQFKTQLHSISQIHIPRYVFQKTALNIQLHGFCDASERGYAAVAYFRLAFPDNPVKIHIITAKSKVSPLKRISLPRLELCAALLLAKLVAEIIKTYTNYINSQEIYAWSDSTVALSWIKASPHRWKTFVCNRVTQIQENLPPIHWRHVDSANNPADCGSRGILPSELINHPLWWAGPPWLSESPDQWPTQPNTSNAQALQEERFVSLATTELLSNIIFDDLLKRVSSFRNMLRITAYINRFIHNCRSQSRRSDPLTRDEIHSALYQFVKHVQRGTFQNVFEKIGTHSPLPKALRKLNLFVDHDGILRVGGRLSLAKLNFEQKHPALLPHKHWFTYRLIEYTHIKYLHAGVQTLQNILAQQFWILCPKRAIRHVISKCINCYRVNPKPLQPPMGNLPAIRLNKIKPFLNVGIDFGGPIIIRSSKLRKAPRTKAYICIFVCAVTKAVHLELVSDLTSEAFLACLRRFIARRGRCNLILSDCGTNFVGASRQLAKYMKTASSAENIEWKFNPPASPNFGGLWEAGIKATKLHLKRVIGEQILTFEESYTVLAQIEAVLNSRPLCPLSSDPADLNVLTPGHFLTLEPLTAVPEPTLIDCKANRLSRWQLLRQMHDNFWKRWQSEYLHTLQQRQKWWNPSLQLNPGDLVLIKNELTPPLQWRRARIVKLHPGNDGVSRVATVRTDNGIVQRPINKLCLLPIPDF